MKKIIAMLVFVIAYCGYFYYQHHSKKPFRCDTQLLTHIEDGNSKIELNLHINNIYTFHNEWSSSITGSVTQDGKEYLVSRTLFFTAKISELNNMYTTRITQEDIDKRDNLPKELWLQYMFPKASGGEFYSELKEMNKNAVLIQSLSNPFYICVRAEDQY